MRILIKGGHVIDPGHINHLADVLIEDGKIHAIDANLQGTLKNPKSVTIIDATDLLVCPGFIDLHVHFREPGFEYKETIATGVDSAVAGGFTTVCCMPNTNPVNDSQSITDFILQQAKIANKARVFPIGAITKGSKGEELAEIGELHEAGCVAISDDGIPVMNSLVMRRAMEYARAFDLPVIDHCEDIHLSAGGSMNEGFVSTELGIPGIPNAAEEVMVARNIFLAELTKSRLHLPHVSTIGSVRLLREAKSRGVAVTAEACPHHFTLTDEAVRAFDTNAKMNPPLRTDADVQAVKDALKDGSIDVIATDHAPHATHEKQRQFDNAPFGIIGLETALPLTLNLVDEGVLTLEQAIAKLTVEPARVFKLSYGKLTIGADADVTLIDHKKSWTLDPNRLYSKSRNTPFAGWTLKGKVVKTFVGGRMVYELK
jgi:dihydroorotase